MRNRLLFLGILIATIFSFLYFYNRFTGIYIYGTKKVSIVNGAYALDHPQGCNVRVDSNLLSVAPKISSKDAYKKGTIKYNPNNVKRASGKLYFISDDETQCIVNAKLRLVWQIEIGTGYLGVPYWIVDAQTGELIRGGNLGDI